MKSFSSQLARLHIEHFISDLLSSVPVLSQLPEDASFTCELLHTHTHTLTHTHTHTHSLTHTAWVPQCPPGNLDSRSSNLRDAISVLFTFERRPVRDKQFSDDCRQWLCMLVSCIIYSILFIYMYVCNIIQYAHTYHVQYWLCV